MQSVGDGNYLGKLSFTYSLIQDLAKTSASGKSHDKDCVGVGLMVAYDVHCTAGKD